MRTLTVVKITNKPDLDFIEERAVTDFRAFQAVASLHVKRVRTPMAINAMLEVIESLKKDLHSKRLLVN